MKILHLSSEKTWRGGEQQIAYLLEELMKAGVEVHVALRRGSAFEKHCRNKNIPYLALSFRNTFDFSTASAIKRVCRQEKVDLIHMHSAKSHGLAILSAVLGNRTPMILSRRVDFVPKNNWLTKFKYNHPLIKRIAGVSEKITAIMKDYVRDPSKCLTIHSGIDLSKFAAPPSSSSLSQDLNIGKENFIIGNTAALEDHKDYFTFIDTIAKLTQKNVGPVTALIIGDGSLKRSLQDHVRQLDLEDTIKFTGFRNDLPQLLPQLDVFLMTSKTEGLGTSILDAFAARVAVVATDAGGIPEMVIHNQTGLLAQVGDSETLAEHVQLLMENPAKRNQLIEEGSRKVKEFSKEETAKKTMAMYHDVLNGKRTSR